MLVLEGDFEEVEDVDTVVFVAVLEADFEVEAKLETGPLLEHAAP